MRLKRLELSGFKSFAKNTILDFPNSITAVVGPNGSGKSNVADAVRWVLGEQSLKSLRGKRGEDLIFSGSLSAPRLSKASVFLIFDNSGKEFALDFEEISVGRRVFRDGVNEYLLQNSQLRLKDVIELLAKLGLGSSQHHVIGQGEVDRFLYASPRERREMIEDALGLKIFQLKRTEAERKLGHTEENMRQVQALRREIGPHLKFLKSQAEKFEVASQLRLELKEILSDYLSKKSATLESSRKEISEKKARPLSELQKVAAELRELRLQVERRDSLRLAELRGAVGEGERDLGRLEGMVELEEKSLKGAKEIVVSKKEIESFLSELGARLEKAGGERSLDKILSAVKELRDQVLSFLAGLQGEKREEALLLAKHRRELGELRERLEKIRAEEKKLQKEEEELRQGERRVYELERNASRLKDALRSWELEEEKIRLLEAEFKRELEEAEPYWGKSEVKTGEVFGSPEEAEVLRKKVERLKIRLEEAGGIDPAVLKEYQEVSKRDEFFGKELEDLVKSAEALRRLAGELEEKIEHDFKTGIEKISQEFQKFFQTMFGGGRAALKIVDKMRGRKKSDEIGENGEVEEGININVDLPRKRIKSLDMLSGGERALTSIALLFAMSAVHPPPFLVLDETDAALDEANSDRYAKLLQNLSETTQLIVITHNRTTMKCAGVLYGVTMGADGISKLLSLKFEEAGALVG